MPTDQESRAPAPKKADRPAEEDPVAGAEAAVENEKAAIKSGEESPA